MNNLRKVCGLAVIVLAALPFSGCKKEVVPPGWVSFDRHQEQVELREKLEKENARLKKEKVDYHELAKNYGIYGTLENENKKLKRDILELDTTIRFGTDLYFKSREELKSLKRENFLLKKENQTARDYLESQGKYLSDISKEEINPLNSPLALEKAEHAKTRAEFARIKAESQRDWETYQTDLALKYRLIAGYIRREEFLLGKLREYIPNFQYSSEIFRPPSQIEIDDAKASINSKKN